MNQTLKKLKNISSENCITVIMNSHRTKPDCLKDEITLKNLIKDVENRLLADTTKRDATALLDKLNALANQIDHNYNLDSLMLFVNHDIAEFTRLHIPVEDRVAIDDTFATRDLIRALNSESNYYILVLSQEKARLIEALNDKVIEEFKTPFPLENKHVFTRNKSALANASSQSSLLAEFFNEVDKEVNVIRKRKPLPVLICGLEENYSEYIKVVDEKHSILNTFFNDNKITEKDYVLAPQAWEVVKAYNAQLNTERKSELLKAVSENKFLSDTNEIYQAIKEGRIQTLFIEQGLFQPAILKDNQIKYVSIDHREDKGVIDDVFDELIELNTSFGGEVVFLPKGALKKFNGFGAITRY